MLQRTLSWVKLNLMPLTKSSTKKNINSTEQQLTKYEFEEILDQLRIISNETIDSLLLWKPNQETISEIAKLLPANITEINETAELCARIQDDFIYPHFFPNFEWKLHELGKKEIKLSPQFYFRIQAYKSFAITNVVRTMTIVTKKLITQAETYKKNFKKVSNETGTNTFTPWFSPNDEH